MTALTKSLTLLAAFAALSGLAPAQEVHDKIDAVRAADQEWARVFAAKDLALSVAACAPDAAVLAPNAPIATGRDEIRQLFQGFFALPALRVTWHPTKIDVASSGDLAYSTGVYEMHFNDATGKPISDQGKYVTVWKQAENGKWQVVRDIFNSDLPR